MSRGRQKRIQFGENITSFGSDKLSVKSRGSLVGDAEESGRAPVGSGDTESQGRLRWPGELDGKSLQQGHTEGVDGNGQVFSAREGQLAAPG